MRTGADAHDSASVSLNNTKREEKKTHIIFMDIGVDAHDGESASINNTRRRRKKKREKKKGKGKNCTSHSC